MGNKGSVFVISLAIVEIRCDENLSCPRGVVLRDEMELQAQALLFVVLVFTLGERPRPRNMNT